MSCRPPLDAILVITANLNANINKPIPTFLRVVYELSIREELFKIVCSGIRVRLVEATILNTSDCVHNEMFQSPIDLLIVTQEQLEVDTIHKELGNVPLNDPRSPGIPALMLLRANLLGLIRSRPLRSNCSKQADNGRTKAVFVPGGALGSSQLVPGGVIRALGGPELREEDVEMVSGTKFPELEVRDVMVLDFMGYLDV